LADDYALIREKNDKALTRDWNWFWGSLFVGIAYTAASVVETFVGRYAITGHGYLSLVSVLLIAGCLRNLLSIPLGIKTGNLAKIMVLIPALTSLASIGYALWKGVWLRIPAYPLASFYLTLASVGMIYGSRLDARRMLERFAWIGSISYALYMLQNPIERVIYPHVPRAWNLGLWWGVNTLIFILAVMAACFLELKFQPWIAAKLKAGMINSKRSQPIPAPLNK
jgi:peptidoglycan/LPS O-acetylase OafA/YrhL